MARKYPQILFSDSVRKIQTHYGARESGAKMEAWEMNDEQLSSTEMSFIRQRDGFYMATIGKDGWPYVQFRGGPKGFLHIVDDRTLGYADLRGNRQYISMGNLFADDRVSLFLMDYPNQRRLKLTARAEVFDASPHGQTQDAFSKIETSKYAALAKDLLPPDSHAQVERFILLHLVAFDWNCPQHITPRFSEAELAALQ